MCNHQLCVDLDSPDCLFQDIVEIKVAKIEQCIKCEDNTGYGLPSNYEDYVFCGEDYTKIMEGEPCPITTLQRRFSQEK